MTTTCGKTPTLPSATFTMNDVHQNGITIHSRNTVPKSGRINGYNPCCFVGDTELDTAEGRFRLDWLAEMARGTTTLPMVFAWNLGSNLPVLSPITKVWLAGKTTRVSRVTTDKGLVLSCMSGQKFLTRAGEYVEAQRLTLGTRLRKIGRFVNSHRSNRNCINHRTTEEHKNGTVIQTRWMWEQIHGPIPDGMDVHHLNEDPTDDRISNLELKPSLEHHQEHSKGSANKRFIEVEDRLLVETWEAVEASRKRISKAGAKATPATWNKYVQNNNLKGSVPLANSKGGGRIQGMPWASFAEHIERNRGLVNDTIASVEEVVLDIPVNIYDVEIEGTNNFAIAYGQKVHSIIVHSSESMKLDAAAWRDRCAALGILGCEDRAV